MPGSEVAPPPPAPASDLPPGVQPQQAELDLHPELRLPDSVPMLRPTFAPYVFGDVPASSVEDFLAQSVPGRPEGENYLYAGINMAIPTTGVFSFINAYNGNVETTTMSVLEMAVACPGSDPDTTRELVGVVASRDRKHFDKGANTPAVTRLQVEFWTAGHKNLGDEVGGWHGLHTGFIPLKGAPYGPGGAIIPSEVGGQIYEAPFEIRNSAGGWWISHNGNWLGYYPARLFDQMPFTACEVHWYGEVYDGTPTGWTSTDMGSGRFAAEGLGNAAYFRLPAYLDSTGTPQWPDGAGDASPNDPLCYTSSGLRNDGPLFDRVLYCGGPGGDSPGCN